MKRLLTVVIVCVVMVPWSAQAQECACPCLGDADSSGLTNVLDVVAAVNVAFKGAGDIYDAGCMVGRCDVTCDGTASVADVVRIVNVAFRNGSALTQYCDPCADPLDVIGHSGCKSFAKDAQTASDETCISWIYDGSKLTVRHINAGFNCCPDSLGGTYRRIGDTIVITEIEWVPNPCLCLCLFDLDFQFANLAPGAYSLIFSEPYLPAGTAPLTVTLTLVPWTSDLICLPRTDYPWGGP